MYFIKVRLDRNLRALPDQLHRWMQQMMNLSRPMLSASRADWAPEADMFETQEGVVIVLNLAGVRTEDIEVTFHENHLRVAGHRSPLAPAGVPTRYYHLEIPHGGFERFFQIPEPVREELIEASYTDGLLTIQMKKGPRQGPVRVQVSP